MTRTVAAAAALLYFALGLIAYKGVLNSGFVADDWIFLSYVVPARSVIVCFEPLVGHFVRPLVMLTYYVNYQLFGLWPLPYHVSLIAVHTGCACLVALLAIRVSGSARIGFWAGLIFTAFAGHSEAVGWVAGAADPWLAFFLLSGLLLFASALDAPRPAWRLAASIVMFLIAYLGKESAAIGPALVVAWGASAALARGRGSWRAIALRTAAVAAPLAAWFFVYLAIRASVFGSAFGAYQHLNADRSILGQQVSFFVIRTFYPATILFIFGWLRALGVVAIVAALLTIAASVWRVPERRAGFLFIVAGCVIALLPVVPLTISLTGTTSERFIYIPTVFSCILIAWAVSVVARRRLALELVLVFFILAAQYRPLSRSKVERLAAAELFGRVMTEVIALIRADAPTPATRVILLTVPDSLGGAVVVRSAFHPALSVLAPDISDPIWRVIFLRSHNLHTPDDHVSVAAGEGQFRVALGANQFVERDRPAETADFAITDWTPSGYAVQFKPVRWRRVIAYFGDGRLRKVGDVETSTLDAIPFGVLDVPRADPECRAESVRFSGWALDDQGLASVVIERQDEGGRWTVIATADRPAGTRPDIASMFAGYPGADRGEFNYYLMCSARPPAGALRVRVVVRDSAAHEVVLGERTVTWPKGL